MPFYCEDTNTYKIQTQFLIILSKHQKKQYLKINETYPTMCLGCRMEIEDKGTDNTTEESNQHDTGGNNGCPPYGHHKSVA